MCATYPIVLFFQLFSLSEEVVGVTLPRKWACYVLPAIGIHVFHSFNGFKEIGNINIKQETILL